MRVVEVTTLLDVDPHPTVKTALAEVLEATAKVHWPPGAEGFSIYPQSGKRSGEGNGVLPIRQGFIAELVKFGWKPEVTFPVVPEMGETGGAKFGKMDAAKTMEGGIPPFMVEWETGNISSSHRALNKMALGLHLGAISGAVLIVPTQALAQFLTDRIGNVRELKPYYRLWRSIQIERGFLGIVAIEYDRMSMTVPRIPKGTDGRSAR